MLKFVAGPVGFEHVAPAPFGSVIVHVTAPVGSTALATPLTVVVRVVIPPSVGPAEVDKEIVGNCLTMERLNGLLDTPT